jgi:rhodanese-related sulfurtransferase
MSSACPGNYWRVQTTRKSAVCPEEAAMPTTITREALRAKMEAQETFILVDVLSPESYARGHLPGAINIPVSDVEREAPATLPEDAVIVVYCASFECQASPAAARKLEEMGYTSVTDYEGGLAAWKDADYPLESGTEASTLGEGGCA